MTDHRCDQYLRHLGLLVRFLEGDLAHCISEAGRDEIRRTLSYVEPAPEPLAVSLADSDE